MKKIFSFFAAVLFAGSMMAQAFDHGLYVPANASLEVATEVGTTANLDKTTGDLTINIAGPHTTWGTWGNQIKLTTGITNLDPTKSYEIGFTAVASTDDCPVSHEKAFDDTNFFDIESDKYTTTPFEFKKIVSGTGATNGIMVWSFTWTPAQTVTISNIYVRESVVTYSSLADVRKCAKGDKVTLKAFEVTYAPAADTRYYYIKDATSTCVIYANNYGLKAGDKVDMGLEGEVDIYNGLYEIKPITAKEDLKITSGAAPQPAIATAAPTADDQSQYVVYKKVKVAEDAEFLSTSKNTVLGIFGKDTITFYNSYKIAAKLEASKTYDIVAINSIYNNPQVYPISVEEHVGLVDECAGEHDLYDAEKAVVNDTYFGPDWNEAAGAGCYAEVENGVIKVHFEAEMVDHWNGQVFVDPGFTFTPGKMYHYEFDVESADKVCLGVKVNDSDPDAFFLEWIYDKNIGGGTFHFETDSVIATDKLVAGRGPLVFGFAWTAAHQDVIIKCIKITEIGDAPKPVEPHMYIKHPWGTGKDEDWSWQEMKEDTYMNLDAWSYEGNWGGVGFNIADNEEGNNAKWFAADAIGYRNLEGIVTVAPAVGTKATFYYVPMLDKAESVNPAAYVVYDPQAQGFEAVKSSVKAVKIIRNGQIVIVREGVEYNALGAQL